MGSGRARDDDVDTCKRSGQIRYGTRVAADFFREHARALERAPDHRDVGALVREQPSNRVPHLARAQEPDPPTLQVSEDLTRQIHPHARDRHLTLADGRLGSHALRRPRYGHTQATELRAQRADAAGQIERALHLAEYLRLTDDQRVERCGDAKRVSDGLLALVDIEISPRAAGSRVQEREQPLADRAPCLGLARGDELDAIARVDDDQLPDALMPEQFSGRGFEFVALEREALSNLDGRRLMREARNDDHDAPPPAAPRM